MEIKGFQAGENAMENGETISSLVNDQSIFVVHMDEAGLMTITTRGDPAGWPDGLPKALGTLLKAAGHSLCLIAGEPPQAVLEPTDAQILDQQISDLIRDAEESEMGDIIALQEAIADHRAIIDAQDADDIARIKRQVNGINMGEQETFADIVEAEENDEIRREIDAEEEGVR